MFESFTPRPDAWLEARGPAASALLAARHVALDAVVADSAHVFDAVGAAAHERHGPSHALIAARLARRHARASTALGFGCALPHADFARLEAPRAVYLRLAQPVDFDAPDGVPVSHVVALLVPRPAISADHHLLSRLLQRLSSESFRRELDDCVDAREVCRLFALRAAG